METELEQRHSDCIKIVLYGPESSGKSTLAKRLAENYNEPFVPEFMRNYLQKKWDDEKKICEKIDLLPIASGQMASENKIAPLAQKFLFCDTNLLEIKVYSQFYFDGFCPEPILKSIEKSNYHHYLLLYPDLPWEEDDLRDRPNDRGNMFRIFENELKKAKYPYSLIKGIGDKRLDMAINTIENLLK